MHQQIAMAELSRYFMRQVSGNALGPAVPVQDPPLAVHDVNAGVELVQQLLVEFAIHPSLLHHGVFGVCFVPHAPTPFLSA